VIYFSKYTTPSHNIPNYHQFIN